MSRRRHGAYRINARTPPAANSGMQAESTAATALEVAAAPAAEVWLTELSEVPVTVADV